MLDPYIVPSFAELLPAFQPCFTAPSFSSFVWLASGWVLNLRRHSVTETVKAAQAIGAKHISSFHRCFSRGQGVTDEVGWMLVRLVVPLASAGPTQPLIAPIDDTLGRHTGKKIAAASMHRDPQNRTEHAVERTAPMALWLYSLVVIWYLRTGQHLRAARIRALPWYPSKAAPAFSDRLAALRRSSWLERLSVPCADVPTLRKIIRPILE